MDGRTGVLAILRFGGRAGNQSGDSMGFAVAASRLLGFQSRRPRAHARGYLLALLRGSTLRSMSIGTSFMALVLVDAETVSRLEGVGEP